MSIPTYHRLIQIHEFAVVQHKPSFLVWVGDSRSSLPEEALFHKVAGQVLDEVAGGRLGKRDLHILEFGCSDGGIPVDDVLMDGIGA